MTGGPKGMGVGATAAAVVLSVSAHVALLFALSVAIRPGPIPQQPVPEARMDMQTYEVERSEATEATARGDPAEPGRAEGASASQAEVPQSRAKPTAVAADTAAALRAPATRAEPIAAATGPAATEVAANLTETVQPLAPLAPLAPAAPTAPLEAFAAPVAEFGELVDNAAAIAHATPTIGSAPLPTPAVTRPANAPAAQQGIIRRPESVAARPSLPAAETLVAAASPTAITATRVSAPRPATVAALAAPTAASSPAIAPQGAAAPSQRPTTARLSDRPANDLATDALSLESPADQIAGLLNPGTPIPQTTPVTPAAASLAPPAEKGTAALAWSGDTEGNVDPLSLAAIEAFMKPGDLAASDSNVGGLRDGIGAVLGAVPCARLQTTFVPETGTLELRGHVPDDGLRGPVLAALQSQIGDAIPVADRMLILPRPQCGMLTGIEAVGLAQSTDQLTNPKVIGPDAHVREYRFRGGDALELEVSGADYDSYVHIDYFDAAGNVVHLQPNEFVPPERLPALVLTTVGKERADGGPWLPLQIQPPYGQEIVVAFAASVPLYDGVRPMVEPAEPYLDFLRQRVAELRATIPDFKGEWVYFMVVTKAE